MVVLLANEYKSKRHWIPRFAIPAEADPGSLFFAVVLAPPGGAVPRSRPFHMGARTV